ncbi:MAG: PIG-L family deacetylase [Holophaga sp.]|nr:PIG-L family deacetylase [Holophaga sp.]
MSHPYNHFINEFVRLLDETRDLPLGGLPPAPAPRLADNAPRALVFAPHPDDESIVGGLALRLRRELNFRVCAVAVTQGSRVDRQPARLEEMRAACHFLGFELITTRPNGLTGINPRTREQNPDPWGEAVAVVAQILAYHRASVVFLPHGQDFHSTHIGTHHLVMDALRTLGPGFRCKLVETEYWRAMADPNLMVESCPDDLADLVAAVSFHRGEVARNPYHLSLPAWMADNVRRGSELVGGQGAASPEFRFATLYRLTEWVNGAVAPCLKAPRVVPAGPVLAEIFKREIVPAS